MVLGINKGERMKLTQNQFEGLTEAQYDYSISFDNAVGQYCFTTNYRGSWVYA